MERRLILASASPRRRELLQKLDIRFEIRPAFVDESMLPGEDASTYPLRTAVKKAMAVAEQIGKEEKALIVAADTVVVIDDDILGKPADAAEAKAMICRLAGREHIVITGLGLVDTLSGRTLSAAEQTIVYFNALSEEQIDAYIATGEPRDKAGAYGIQGKGSLLVRKIDGDFYNVMGLPLSRLDRVLAKLDLNLLSFS